MTTQEHVNNKVKIHFLNLINGLETGNISYDLAREQTNIKVVKKELGKNDWVIHDMSEDAFVKLSFETLMEYAGYIQEYKNV